MLVEIDGCVFLSEEFDRSHGFEKEDSVGKESFVNHVHIEGDDHIEKAEARIYAIIDALRAGWPRDSFRVYHQIDPAESVVRFHKVREFEPNFCDERGQIGDSQMRIIEINP